MFTALGAFMSNITAQIGDLTALISYAIATYGNHLIASSKISGDNNTPGTMNFVANAWFADGSDETGKGLIYWINDKLVYLLRELNNATEGLAPASWEGLEDLLIALTNAGIL